MDTRILVLGAGRMGRIIAPNLAEDYIVTVADIKMPPPELWEQGIQIVKADLEDYDKLKDLIGQHDMVVGALPAAMSYRAMFACVEAKKPMADVSYMLEDPTSLNDMAIQAKVPILVDIGIAPGLTNLLVGHVLEEEGEILSGKLFVGGMAADKNAPYGYRLTWSPSDLLAEYKRPARYIDNGRIVSRPAMSGIEEVQIPGLGILEGFLTDGLRTLLNLKNVHCMIEKTLRWPGHVEAVKPLIEQGNFIEEMQDKCSTGDDIVVLHCEIDHYHYNMIIDAQEGMTALQRSTALTCATFTRILAECGSLPPGVTTPEMFGADLGLFAMVIDNLEKYGLDIEETINV